MKEWALEALPVPYMMSREGISFHINANWLVQSILIPRLKVEQMNIMNTRTLVTVRSIIIIIILAKQLQKVEVAVQE
jgi:hypothetical protein